MEIWVQIIVPILTGLAATIPLVVKLVDVIKESYKEKNWKTVVQLVIALMKEAENNFTDGADKKQYVLSSIKAMEASLHYDVDEEAIGALVDSIIEATKYINVK